MGFGVATERGPGGRPGSARGISKGVAVAADGSFTYDPPADFSGTDPFGYTASDGTLTDTATVTVTVNP